MMVILKNKSGAVRVVYDVNEKAHPIPPGGDVEIMLHPNQVKRYKAAQAKGDKLLVEKVDFQPLDDDPPPGTPVSPPSVAPRIEFQDDPEQQDPAPARPRGRRRARA